MKREVLAIVVLVFGVTVAVPIFARVKSPNPGLYFYCDPTTKSLRSLKVTKKNLDSLGSDEIHFVCVTGGSTPKTCSLSFLASKSVSVIDEKNFIWTPTEGEDCGIGCFFEPIRFSKNKPSDKFCK